MTDQSGAASLTNILLIEDDATDAELLRQAFIETHFPNELKVVTTGEAALDLLYRRPPYEQVERPDMIMLDLGLPGMSGSQVLERIKSDESLADIPVIILSGSGNQADIQTAYRNHANSYVVKPASFKMLVKVVRNIQEFWFQIVKLPK